jgi:lipoprotein-anchoring transpeptidase ErfK/SrfK
MTGAVRPMRGRGVRAAVLAAILAAGMTLAACGQPGASSPAHHGSHPVGQSAPGPSGSTVPSSTVVATLHSSIPRFAAPGGPQDGTVPAVWYGSPSALPVVASQPGWLQVRLAQRPNNSTAWILASDVSLARTPYAIVVNLNTKHLTLYNDGKAAFSAPVGIGVPADPTPTGHYFTALFASPPTPDYGAFVMVTSAHSNTITDWSHSGDAVVAIHGPLGSDAQIGTTGAAVSHGCIRLHEPDLVHLRQVPAGSPIDIVA